MWIELFRAGNYGDQTFTADDLDRIVANYDAAYHEAPVTLGAPVHDAPAYGWVQALRRAGNALMGKLTQVPEKFGQLVSQGYFKKRSISFYRSEKGPSLRHIGFIGEVPRWLMHDIHETGVAGFHKAKCAQFCADKENRVTHIDITERRRVEFNEPAQSGAQAGRESVTLAERAMAISVEQKIPYGEALMRARREAPLNFSESTMAAAPVLQIAPNSVILRNAAEKIARERKISFGEALCVARREWVTFTDDVVDPAKVKDAVAGALRDFFTAALGGKQGKIIGGTEVFSAGEKVAEALGELKIQPRIVAEIKAAVTSLIQGILKKDTQEAHITSADADALVAKAAGQAEQLYTKDLAALGA